MLVVPGKVRRFSVGKGAKNALCMGCAHPSQTKQEKISNNWMAWGFGKTHKKKRDKEIPWLIAQRIYSPSH